jgi:exodeoxyribonuclease VII large subunit
LSQVPDTSQHRLHVAHQARRLSSRFGTHLATQRHMLSALSAQLEMLNPQRTLERGYAIVTDEKGKVLRTPQELQPRHNVTVRLAQGTAKVGIATVQQVLE